MPKPTETQAAILDLIIQGVLAERRVESLVEAYLDDLGDDLEAETGCEPDSRADFEALGVVCDAADLEALMQERYCRRYCEMVRHPVSSEQALEVFQYPLPGFPEERVPRHVVLAVARALADRDAREANAMCAAHLER